MKPDRLSAMIDENTEALSAFEKPRELAAMITLGKVGGAVDFRSFYTTVGKRTYEGLTKKKLIEVNRRTMVVPTKTGWVALQMLGFKNPNRPDARGAGPS